MDVGFDRVMVFLKDIRVDELVLLGCLEVHAELVAELFLQALEVVVEEDLLESAHDLVELVVLLVVAYIR